MIPYIDLPPPIFVSEHMSYRYSHKLCHWPEQKRRVRAQILNMDGYRVTLGTVEHNLHPTESLHLFP